MHLTVSYIVDLWRTDSSSKVAPMALVPPLKRKQSGEQQGRADAGGQSMQTV